MNKPSFQCSHCYTICIITKSKNAILPEPLCKSCYSKLLFNKAASYKIRDRYFIVLTQRFNGKYKTTLKPQQLWGLLKKQRMLCPYSKIKLNRNNISLDHIIPLAEGGGNDVSNLQFVHFNINIMKQSLAHKDFILLCNLVATNNKTSDIDTAKLSDKIKIGLTKRHITD